jgi:imidazolonepropionase-like amidohydrolase
MRYALRVPACCLLLFSAFSHFRLAQAQIPAITLFEGARLVNSDGSAPIESSAFLVVNDRIAQIGRKGAIALPRGGRRVDLAGKTVIPALVDAHAHLGYMKNLSIGPENYTRDNLLDHLRRHAYYGVAVGSTWGSDFGDMPFEVRDTVTTDAARFVTLWRGLTTPGEGTPGNMRQNAFVVATEDDCRKAVRELAAHKVPMVKIWVQDRPAGIPKMSPELYKATIDEAHKHNMKVVVHAQALQDVKALLRAGIDGFAHLPLDTDDELMEMLEARPTIFFTPTLGTARRMIYSPWLEGPDPLVRDTVSPAQIQRLKDRIAAQTPDAIERVEQSWAKMQAVFKRLVDADARIALGSDAGGMSGDQFIGWTAHTELENMVDAGMTPSQALVAATKTPAEILGLQADLGALASGKSASFIVLDANPMEAITNTRKISQVFLRGKAVDREGLRARWSAP